MVTESSQSRMKANSYWPDISESYIRPVERQAGMTTFGTLLKANGRCEDGTGALKAHEQEDHARRVHADRELAWGPGEQLGSLIEPTSSAVTTSAVRTYIAFCACQQGHNVQ